MTGRWLGRFTWSDDAEAPAYMLVTFASGVSGTLDFPLQRRQSALASVTFESGRLHFEAVDRSEALTFDGQVAGDTISGTVRQTGAQGAFELMRLSDVAPGAYRAYTGRYVAEADRFIAVFMNGDDLLVRDYVTGRLAMMLPVSETTFIIGPAWGVPYPVEARIEFQKDAQGGVTGFAWQPIGPADGETAFTATQAAPFFKAEEVRFHNGEITLAGTLVTPLGEGPHPAVVLLHGSERGRRTDVYPRLRAEWLAYHGVAVLLYDKRGVGDSTGVYQEYAGDRNIDNLAGDGLAGVEYLKTRSDIQLDHIGLMGSSQAGWVGPRIAARSADVAFMILVSGPTVSPGQEALFEDLDRQRRNGSALTEDDITQRVLAARPGSFDPLPYLEATSVPTLWIYGGLDKSIPAAASIAVLDRLRESGQANFSVRLYPAGNHSLLDSKTGYPEEMPYVRGLVRGYEQATLDWLLEQTASERFPLIHR